MISVYELFNKASPYPAETLTIACRLQGTHCVSFSIINNTEEEKQKFIADNQDYTVQFLTNLRQPYIPINESPSKNIIF